MPFYTNFIIATELIAAIIGTYYLKRMGSKFLYLYVFVCIALITEVSQSILFKLGINNNMWLSHIYFPLEFFFIAVLYLYQFKRFFKRKWIVLVISLFMLFCLINPLFIQGINAYSQVRSFSSIVLILFSIFYFYKVMIEAKISKLSSEPMIWVNTAVLLYFSSSLFYNVLFTLVLDYSREFSKLTTWCFGVFTIVFYLLIAIGFWKAGIQKHVR